MTPHKTTVEPNKDDNPETTKSKQKHNWLYHAKDPTSQQLERDKQDNEDRHQETAEELHGDMCQVPTNQVRPPEWQANCKQHFLVNVTRGGFARVSSSHQGLLQNNIINQSFFQVHLEIHASKCVGSYRDGTSKLVLHWYLLGMSQPGPCWL